MIYVCDAIMGAGKSSAAMWHINHSDRRFVYMTPYLSEVNRVVKNCSDRNFVQPKGSDSGLGGKTADFYRLLRQGENIASTHAMFGRMDPDMTETIKSLGYDLVLDEVYNVLQNTVDHRRDMLDAIQLGYVQVEEGGWLKWTCDDYDGVVFAQMRNRIHSMKIMQASSDTNIAVLFPPEVFEAFQDVYIMTYMFDSSLMKYYFEMCGLEYQKIWPMHVDDHYELSFTPQPRPEYTRHLVDHIHVVDDRINSIGDGRTALSASWYARNRSKQDGVDQLRRNLRTFQRRCGSGSYKNLMWCCFKEYKSKINDSHTMHGFVPVGIRATNEFSRRTDVAYLVNVFFNPYLKSAIESNGVEVDEDGYALSEMIQWVWRSAIRDGKDITLYVPSARMRELFVKWLQNLANAE